jgi:DNA helicase HerA-like ATPase
MAEMPMIAKGAEELYLLPGMSNRHGLVAGATGTGKTVTLQVMAEALSSIGVPVFAADVKGDLSGISQAGKSSPKFDARVAALGLGEWSFAGSPVVFWDVFGKQGHPVRATVSEMGPLLLSRILNLNDTQAGVLTLVFKIADEGGLLLLDMKDLQAMLRHVGDSAKEYQTQYGNISAASIGAIQRGLVALGQQGGDLFFGEPALNIEDLLQTDAGGKGVVNILAADQLLQSPQLYATFLLWLMSELFEKLPEVGDVEKPKLVFFFDEAHLLFNDLPSVLQNRIEQVVRLIRSKGVGVFFVTQNPIDVPDTVLGQLGNRVQHALRAFSPKDQKAVKAAAQTFRANPKVNVEAVITEMGVGEALVSFLDDKGTPGMVERAMILPPHSQIGPITPEQRAAIIKSSVVAGVYETVVDRESAYERLKGKVAASGAGSAAGAGAGTAAPVGGVAGSSGGGWLESAGSALGGVLGSGGSRRGDTVVQAMVKSAARTMGSTVGRQIIRGVLGSLLGGSSKR